MAKRWMNWLGASAGASAVLGLVLCAGVAGAQEKKDGDKVEVKLELPKMVFAGTPKAIPPNTTVQPPRKGPREPLLAPAGTKNIALNKKVTSSDNDPVVGNLDMVTDGQKEGTEGNWVELGPDIQWVQIDLGKESTVYGILVWHQHADPRVYRDVVFQVSNDPEFKKDVVTVYNNDQDNSAKLGAGKDFEYFEAAEGLLVDTQKTNKDGVKGRYVRLYSKGSTADDQNHYTEVEVFGTQK
jgi:hypothetical protein